MDREGRDCTASTVARVLMEKSNRFPADGVESTGRGKLGGGETFVPMIVHLRRHSVLKRRMKLDLRTVA